MSLAEHGDASRVFTGCGKTVHFYRRCREGNCKWIGDFVAIKSYLEQAAGCYDLAPLVRNVNGSEFQVAACGELLGFKKSVEDGGEMSFRLTSRRPLFSRSAPEPSRGERTSYQRVERPLEPKAIFARAFRAIVQIEAGGRLGTGFGIDTEGLIVTNVHVISGSSRIEVRQLDGTSLQVSEVYAFDVDRDLAILRVKASTAALPLVRRHVHAIGERVVAIGNPLGLTATMSEGIISGVRESEKAAYIQTTAPISPGSSGGPVMNEHAEVIAVATFLLKGANNVGFGVSSKHLRALLDRPRPISLERFAQETASADAARSALVSLDGCTEDDRDRMVGALERVLRRSKTGPEGSEPSTNDVELADALSKLHRSLGQRCQGPQRYLEGVLLQAKAISAPNERTSLLVSAASRLLDSVQY